MSETRALSATWNWLDRLASAAAALFRLIHWIVFEPVAVQRIEPEASSAANHAPDAEGRPERGVSRPPREWLELIDVRTALELPIAAAQAILKHRARLVRELGEAPRVRVCPNQLEQVFLNLLVNAAQAIPAGEPDANMVRVAVKSAENEAAVIVEVQDTGCGIAAQDLPKIFEPFFTTKYDSSGAGLGLAIAEDIVTGFGGRIEVATELGRGSTFRVILPAAERLANDRGLHMLEPDQEARL